MAQREEVTPLRGGLDLVSPAMMVKPGYAIAAQNYEVEARGYRRITGYERFDGRPKPSAATYVILDFDGGSTEVLEDETVTGATSGATGIALVDGQLESGSYGGGDAAGHLVLYNVSGDFEDDENLEVSASTVAVADGTALTDAASTDTLHNTYIQSVTSKRRNVIAKPSGSGPIRGVATLKGEYFCWRDNAGGTAGQMFKATASGWVLQSFGHYIYFDAGKSAPQDGDLIYGKTSGATGTIEHIVLNDGAWDGSGSGYFVLSGVTGSFVDGEDMQVDDMPPSIADTDGTEVAITLPAGGTYRSITRNFFAQEGTLRLYVVNGVGPAFEWDGSVLAPIFTGLSAALEKPKHIGEQRHHLFLGYEGGSLQGSAIGLPLVFDAAQGAVEIGFGQDITGIKSQARDSMIVAGRNKIGYLVGASSSDFEMRSISEDSGAIEGTLDVVGNVIFMDDQGVRDMKAAESYGDWRMGTLTRMVEPLIKSKRDGGITVFGAFRVRAKDQYRLLFDDGTGLVLYFGRKEPEVLPVSYGFTPSAVLSGEDANGNEVLFAGDEDGWVYELDRGTSFDGSAIEAFLRTSFLNQRSPNVVKRYHRARLEGQAGGTNAAVGVVADFAYGNSNQPSSAETNFTFYGGGGFWDEAYWDEFNWSSAVEGQAFAELSGLGENVSVVFISDTAIEEPHTLSALTINYTLRRKMR